MRKHFIFDLDQTLVETSNLVPYMKNYEGRKYAAENIMSIPTKEIDKGLVGVVNSLHRRGSVSIVTNSPSDYARAVLKKHGFFSDLPLYPSAKKPQSSSLEKVCRDVCISPSDVLSVGDSAIDILAAHGANMPSLAVCWGSLSTPDMLKRAEPSRLCVRSDLLEQNIVDMQMGKIQYAPRLQPRTYAFAAASPGMRVDEIEIYPVGEYHRYASQGFDSHSKTILTYKRAKEHFFDEIKAGKTDDFFWSGSIRQGQRYIDSMTYIYTGMSKVICSLQSDGILKGSSICVGIPNSKPEFCYKADVNNILAYALNKNLFGVEDGRRNLFRIFPKNESHSGGERSPYNHLITMGAEQESIFESDNAILIDDISTTGSQVNSAGHLLRCIGYRGKIIAVVAGYTQKNM